VGPRLADDRRQAYRKQIARLVIELALLTIELARLAIQLAVSDRPTFAYATKRKASEAISQPTRVPMSWSSCSTFPRSVW
jgi:hypothetical protein